MTISDQILDKTNGGADIFTELFGEWKEKKPIAIRNENSPSAFIFKGHKNIFYLKDFGVTDSKAKNAIVCYQERRGIEYREAIKELARKYCIFPIAGAAVVNRPKIEQETNIAAISWAIPGFALKTKDFTDKDLAVLGRFVTSSICLDYNFYSLEYYIISKDDKAYRVSSTATFPIFAIIGEDDFGTPFYKIYQPLSEDKGRRFFYKGNVPKGYAWGQTLLNKKYLVGSAIDEKPRVDVVITTGLRDMLNCASLGIDAVCFSSETFIPEVKNIDDLRRVAKKIYYCGDLDNTGQLAVDAILWRYPEIHNLELPLEITQKKDFRGNHYKDLTDFVTFYKEGAIKKIHTLIQLAPKLMFWENSNANISAYDLMFFAKKLGFFALIDESEHDGLSYIQIENNIKKRVLPFEIRDAILSKVLTMTNSTFLYNALSVKNLLKASSFQNIEKFHFTPIKTDGSFDIIDIDKKRFRVCADGIKECKRDTIIDASSVWREVENFTPQKEPVFECSDDLKTLSRWDTNNALMNFIINISRPYGEKENNPQSGDLNGDGLTLLERLEQHENTINKLYCMGFLFSEDKPEDNNRAIIALDGDYTDEQEAHGGVGKSLLFEMVKQLKPSVFIDGKRSNLFENEHIYGQVSRETRFILFDDLAKDFDEKKIYTLVTGDLVVNAKHKQQITIKKNESPKIGITSNYAIRSFNHGSTSRRYLPILFYSWYHAGGDGLRFEKPHQPKDDFGKNFFSNEWTTKDWADFYNFALTCISFYHKVKKRGIKALLPPMGDFKKRSMLKFIGDSAMDFFNNYIIEDGRENTYIHKTKLIESYKAHTGQRNATTAGILKRAENWAYLKGLVFNPKDLQDARGRIRRRLDNDMQTDCIFFRHIII